MKRFIIALFLTVLSSVTFAFEGFSRNSATKDGYEIEVYQIDKEEHPDSYEFYVNLISSDSKEYFTWCFDNLKDTMEHFAWLQDYTVKSIYKLFGQDVFEDRRSFWRECSDKCDPLKNGYVRFWISKDVVLRGEFHRWR